MTEERYIFGRGAPRNTPVWATVKGLIDAWKERYDAANSSERSRIVDEEIINVVGEQNFFRRCSDGTLIMASRRDIRSHLQTKFSHKNKNKTRPSPEPARSAVPVQQQKLASIQGQGEPQVPQATERQEAAHWEKSARPEITCDKNSKVLFVKRDAARHVSLRQPSRSIGEHTYTQGSPLMQHDVMVRSTKQHCQASTGASTSRHTVAPKNVPLHSQHLAVKQEASQHQGASFYPLGESVELPLDLFERGFDFESDEDLGLLGLQRLPNGTVPVMFCTEQDLGATEGATENHQLRNEGDTPQREELAGCEATRVLSNGSAPRKMMMEETLVARKPPPTDYLDDEEVSIATTKTCPSSDGGPSPLSSPLSGRGGSSQDELWTQPRAPCGFRIVRVTMACQVCTTPFEMHVLDVPEFQCTYCKCGKRQHRKTRSDDDDPDDTVGNKDNQNNNDGKSDKREGGGLGRSQGGNGPQSGAPSGSTKSIILKNTLLRMLAKASMVDNGSPVTRVSSRVEETSRDHEWRAFTVVGCSSATPTLPKSSPNATFLATGNLDERSRGSEQVFNLIDERIALYLSSPIKILDPVTQTSRFTLVADVLALLKRLGGSFKIPGTDDVWCAANEEVAQCLIAHLFWVRSRQHHNSQVPPVLHRRRLSDPFCKQPPLTENQIIPQHRIPTSVSFALSTANYNDGVTSSAQSNWRQEQNDGKIIKMETDEAQSLQSNESQRGAAVVIDKNCKSMPYPGSERIPNNDHLSLSLLADTAMSKVADSKIASGSTPPIDLTKGLAWGGNTSHQRMSSSMSRGVLLLNSNVANTDSLNAMKHDDASWVSSILRASTAPGVVESNSQNHNNEIDSAKRQFSTMRLSEAGALDGKTKKAKLQLAVVDGHQAVGAALGALGEPRTNNLHQDGSANDARIPRAVTGKYTSIDTLVGHENTVLCCSVWNDGHHLLSGSMDKTIKVWQRKNDDRYHCIQTLNGHSGWVNCCVVWNDGRHLLSGSMDKTLKVWQRKNDGRYHCTQTLQGHFDTVFCCVVWNGGQYLLSGSHDFTLKVWEQQSAGQYHCIQTLKGHFDTVFCCAVWNDGHHLLSGSTDTTLKVWERQRDGQYQCIQTLQGHVYAVRCCAVWNNGRHLLSGSYDTTLKVWERQSDGQYHCIQTLNGHSGLVRCCAVWENGSLLSGSKDNTLKVWERQLDGRYQCLRTLQEHSREVDGCAVWDNGQHLLSGSTDGTLMVWKLES